MDFAKMGARVLRELKVAKGSEGDMLGAAGREADLGQDADSMSTHHDLDNDDLENVDTRPKQGA